MNIVDDQLPLSFRSTSRSSARQDKCLLYHTQGWDSPWEIFPTSWAEYLAVSHSEESTRD